jgi:hypothetical protein
MPPTALDKLQQGEILPVAVIRNNTPRQVWQPDRHAGEQFAGSAEWESVQDYSGRKAFDSIVKEALLLRNSRGE